MTTPASSSFIVTKEYRRFEEFCHACQREKYIGICYGPPGVGKTLSARHFAQWHLVEGRTVVEITEQKLPRKAAKCRSLFYTPTVSNTPLSVQREIELHKMLLRYTVAYAASQTDTDPDIDRCQLIIIDEADRLRMSSLEQLRDIYDRQPIGMILMGMPGLEKRLARYAQLYSRVGFAHHFRPLAPEEVQFVLQHHSHKLGWAWQEENFSDQEAIAAIIRITQGNFRLMHRLFRQMNRIMEVNQLHHISQQVVEAARECLVIGMT